MNELKVFNNDEFGEIRTSTIDGEPMFCLADVCKALGLTQPSKVKERLNEKGVNSIPTLTSGGTQNLLYINESNLYKTIFQSRKESAERFTDWVTSEVLPSIRKTGSYQKPMTALEQIQLTQQAVIEVNEKIDTVSKNLENFKEEMPVLGCDIDILTNAKNKKIVPLLGGKNSEAYRNNSTRGKVYSDIANEIKRQFNIPNHKCLRRNQMEQALKIIENYELPICLKEEIESLNSQISF